MFFLNRPITDARFPLNPLPGSPLRLMGNTQVLAYGKSEDMGRGITVNKHKVRLDYMRPYLKRRRKRERRRERKRRRKRC